ncbi:hypothetical protein GOBAR_DD34753 [Gossypium barbadense]|nr:hypothetical protein GOBAR_DD34753 [Gossypium barbadense]
MVPRLKDEHWRKYKHQVSGSPFNPQPWRNSTWATYPHEFEDFATGLLKILWKANFFINYEIVLKEKKEA